MNTHQILEMIEHGNAELQTVIAFGFEMPNKMDMVGEAAHGAAQRQLLVTV
jgi:hypothetical protein